MSLLMQFEIRKDALFDEHQRHVGPVDREVWEEAMREHYELLETVELAKKRLKFIASLEYKEDFHMPSSVCYYSKLD